MRGSAPLRGWPAQRSDDGGGGDAGRRLVVNQQPAQRQWHARTLRCERGWHAVEIGRTARGGERVGRRCAHAGASSAQQLHRTLVSKLSGALERRGAEHACGVGRRSVREEQLDHGRVPSLGSVVQSEPASRIGNSRIRAPLEQRLHDSAGASPRSCVQRSCAIRPACSRASARLQQEACRRAIAAEARRVQQRLERVVIAHGVTRCVRRISILCQHSLILLFCSMLWTEGFRGREPGGSPSENGARMRKCAIKQPGIKEVHWRGPDLTFIQV